MRIGTIVGARPQFVKASAVSRAFNDVGLQEVLIHTGQHYDAEMSDIFFDELCIRKPDYDLEIGSASHGIQTGRMMAALDEVVRKESLDVILVYGDTNSTLAGALVAAKERIPLCHVEAGLRSFNRRMPEEVNRVVTDVLATVLFAPTDSARANLLREGINSERVHVVGDVMYDVALAHGADEAKRNEVLRLFDLSKGNYVLATIHRAENTDDLFRLQIIVEALYRLAESMPVIWPIHPRTRQRLIDLNLPNQENHNLRMVQPLGYVSMACLEKCAAVVMTDSGGVQKEAFFHGVPCVTVREETEWPELVSLNWNRLAPPNSVETVVNSVRDAIGTVGLPSDPFGGGEAAKRIARILSTMFDPTEET